MAARDKEYELKLNEEYYVVTANNLIKGHQTMSLREAQLLFIAISQVVKEDKDFKTYTTTVPELARFMGIDESSLYRDLKSICKRLCQRVVEVQVGGENAKKDKWKIFQWINRAEYDNGTLTIRLSDDIKPYLLNLNNYYTQTMLGILLSFKSYYTSRLYQYLYAECGEKRNLRSEWTFSCEEIRELFQVDEKDSKGNYKKYKLPRDLLKNTIIAALNELNNSDYAYVWNYREHKSQKRGRPISGVSFSIIFFPDGERKNAYLNRLPLLNGENEPPENEDT